MDVKVTNFIVALIMVGLVAATFGLFMADVADNDPNVDYNAEDFQEKYNFTDEIHELADETENKTQGLSETTGVTDVIGSFFTGGFNALRITAKSLNFFREMLSSTTQQFGLGKVFFVSFMSIVIILIIVGVIIRAVTKTSL